MKNKKLRKEFNILVYDGSEIKYINHKYESHGYFQKFYLDGNIKFIGQKTKGRATGLWKVYDPDGKISLIEECTYDSNEFIDGLIIKFQ